MERFASEIASMNADAEARFERSPLPMAFPKEMDPPQTFHLSWKPEPVPLKAEERVASFVVKRGDFGWLNDDRVDEIWCNLLHSAKAQTRATYSNTVFPQHTSIDIAFPRHT